MADVTNYTIENASGANVRTDLNNVFGAIQSCNSKSSDLATSQCVAGMHFLNTTTKLLKIRNSTNNGFTDIGNIDSANLGLLPRSGGIMTGVLQLDDSNSASTPALSFDGDTDLGLYRVSANILGFSSGGTEQMIFDAGVNVPSPAKEVCVPPKETEVEPIVIVEVSTKATVPVVSGKVKVLLAVTVPAFIAT